MTPSPSAGSKLRYKFLLVIGFCAVIGATAVAHVTPATTYELSIYAMTPAVVWICLGVAFIAGLYTAMQSVRRTNTLQKPALVLSGLAVTTFVGMPVIRGYQFNGHGDSLTHLGWATALRDGSLSPFELLYPALHAVTVMIESVFAIPLTQSLMLIPVLTAVVFFIFIPLASREIVSEPSTGIVASACAFLLLPITTFSINLHPHTMSQTLLLSALPIYIIIKYISAGRPVEAGSAVGLLLFIVTAGTVLYHPQYLAHLIIALTGISAAQFIARRLSPASRLASHRTIHAQLLLMVAVLALWSANHGFFSGFVQRALFSAGSFVFGESGQAGESVAAQGASLQAIGGGVGEAFFKIFFGQLVLSLFAGGLILWAVVRGDSNPSQSTSSFAVYFGIALFNLGTLFVVYFVSQTSEMYFRVFGLMMVFVTILGAVAIDRSLVSRALNRTGGLTFGLSIALSLLVVFSLVAAFPSPFIYNQSHHVSETELSGYETALSNQNSDADFVGFRNAPNRYTDAVTAATERTRTHGTISESAFEEGLGTYYDEETYVAISRTDYEREVNAYQELRYSADNLESIDAQSGINRVQSNGEYDLYHIPSNTQ